MFSKLLPLSVAVTFCAFTSSALAAVIAGNSPFNIRDYGAVGDGVQLDRAAINRAIEICAAAGGGTVLVPPGRYLTGTIMLKSHVSLEIAGGATILGSQNPDDYPATKSVWGDATEMMAPLLYAEDAENITVTGRGTIDGQGAIWWKRLELANPNPKRGWAPPQTPAEIAGANAVKKSGRPHLFRPVRCHDVVIEHVTIRDSAEWNIHPMLCTDVRIDGVTILADKSSHNTDGINPESCSNVQISNCRIDTGDDCVTLKSGINDRGRHMGKPDENITITNCVMYRGHGGVTIGSEMSGGVRNVVVANCVFQGTDVGIRIKSQRGRGGVVEGVAVSNIIMQDVPTPFFITTFYMGSDQPEDEHPVDEGTPHYRDFVFSNITARGAKSAGSITGLREAPIENVTFNNVRIGAQTGFVCTNTRDITFLDVVIDTQAGAALLLRNSREIAHTRLSTRLPHEGVALVSEGDATGKP